MWRRHLSNVCIQAKVIVSSEKLLVENRSDKKLVKVVRFCAVGVKENFKMADDLYDNVTC